MQQAPEKRLTIWNRMFICCVLANCFLYTGQGIVNPLVTTYAAYIGAGASVVGMISGLYFGISFAMRPVSGPMVTMLDKKKLMIFTYAIGVAANLGYGLSQSVGLFVASRMLHGVQFSLLGSLTLTVASDSLPKEKMGSGIGVFGLSGIFGTAFGPTIGLALRDLGDRLWGGSGGFRLTFFAAAGITLLALIPCLVMEDQPKPDREALKALGPWYKNIIAPETLPCAVILCCYCMSSGLYNIFMVPYAEQYGIGNVGIFFPIYAVAMLVTRPVSGRLLDRHGAAFVCYPCSAVAVASYLVLGLVHTMTGVVIAAILAGVAWGTLNPALQAMAMQTTVPAKRGVASNTGYLGMDMGFFLGPTLAGLVAAHTGEQGALFLSGMVPVIVGFVIFVLTWRRFQARVKWLERLEQSSRRK